MREAPAQNCGGYLIVSNIVRDAFVCDAVRPPIGRYAGRLAGIRADDLAALPLRALLERNAGLDPTAIEEVSMGCAN